MYRCQSIAIYECQFSFSIILFLIKIISRRQVDNDLLFSDRSTCLSPLLEGIYSDLFTIKKENLTTLDTVITYI